MQHFFFFPDGSQGLKKSQVVDWYLEQIQDSIDSEEELLERKTIIDKVIERLIYKDNILIPLHSTQTQETEEETEEEEEDPVLIVHPNYIPQL